MSKAKHRRKQTRTHLGGADTDVDGGTVSLLAGQTLDVDDPLLAVNLDDLARSTLVGAACDNDLQVGASNHQQCQ